MRWGWNFSKRGLPTPTPRCFCFANAGGAQDPLPDLHSEKFEKQLKIFRDDFFVAAAPRLHHLVPPHLAIPCFHKPPKHNAAVGVGVAHHPMRGVEKGFGAEGGFTQNEGGGA